MGRRTRLVAVGLVLAAVVSSTALVQPAAAASRSKTEKRFLQLLNDYRVDNGVPPLLDHDNAKASSRVWSATMEADRRLAHDPNLAGEMTRAVGDWRAIAENVGAGTAAGTLHREFAKSEVHRANMLNPAFDVVGIGVVSDGELIWVTYRFADLDRTPPPPPSASPAVRYIDAAFHLFLRRGATPGEFDSWEATVASGDRKKLTQTLAVSDEWAGVQVNELYQIVLGRDADAAGRAYWVDQIRRGRRLEDIAASFFGSDEYFNAVDRSRRRLVERLYLDILHRTADAQGTAFWVHKLETGLPRHAVAAEFYASIESRRDRVSRLYGTILGRAPDPAGHDFWADQLRRLGDVVLAAELAASREYFDRVT